MTKDMNMYSCRFVGRYFMRLCGPTLSEQAAGLARRDAAEIAPRLPDCYTPSSWSFCSSHSTCCFNYCKSPVERSLRVRLGIIEVNSPRNCSKALPPSSCPHLPAKSHARRPFSSRSQRSLRISYPHSVSILYDSEPTGAPSRTNRTRLL